MAVTDEAETQLPLLYKAGLPSSLGLVFFAREGDDGFVTRSELRKGLQEIGVEIDPASFKSLVGILEALDLLPARRIVYMRGPHVDKSYMNKWNIMMSWTRGSCRIQNTNHFAEAILTAAWLKGGHQVLNTIVWFNDFLEESRNWVHDGTLIPSTRSHLRRQRWHCQFERVGQRYQGGYSRNVP